MQMRAVFFLEEFRDNQQRDDEYAESDTIPTEYFEIVLFDEVHQELDGYKGYEERHRRADKQITCLRARHRACF